MPPPTRLIRANLKWLGYGHPESRFWFFEHEESMYDHGLYAGCETLEEVLEHRQQYGEYIDFKRAWEELSEFPLSGFAGHSYTWNYEAAFLLGAEGRESIQNKETYEYVFEDARLGRRDGDSFSGEARPLPKSDVEGTGPYAHVWPSVDDYHREVRNQRRQQLNEHLVGSDIVEWVVISGERNLMMQVLRSMFELEKRVALEGSSSKRPYTVYEADIAEDQSVYVVHAPFFGQGRTSYQDAVDAGRRLVHEEAEGMLDG